MTGVRLGIGRERQPIVFIFTPAFEPFQLLRHTPGIIGEKSHRIESISKDVVVKFRRLGLLERLLGLIQVLPAQEIIGERFIPATLWGARRTFWRSISTA